MPRSQQKTLQRLVERFSDCVQLVTHDDVTRELCDFQRDVFGESSRQADPDFTRWAFLRLPGNRLYICKRDGEIIGQQGRLGTTLHVDDQNIDAAWAIDLRVREDWRMRGIGVALSGERIGEQVVAMGLGLSGDAKRMLDRFGWQDLGRIDAFVKPISSAGFTRLSRESSRYRRAVGHILFQVGRLLDRGWHTARRLLGAHYQVEEVADFDSSLEPLIALGRPEARVYAGRSREFLNWRFVECPITHDYRIFVARDNGNPVGLMVVRRRERRKRDTLVIDELFGCVKAQARLIDFLICEAHLAGADAIYYGGLGRETARMLRRRGFLGGKSGHRFMFFTNDKSLEPVLTDRRNWCIRLADSDIGIRSDRPVPILIE